MSTSTFSIVRAAHCSVVAVAWMKTIRAPKTSGTSYENKKDLSADKKKAKQWCCVSAAEERQERENLRDTSKGRTSHRRASPACSEDWLFQALQSQMPTYNLSHAVLPWHKGFLACADQVFAAYEHSEPETGALNMTWSAVATLPALPALPGKVIWAVFRYGSNLIFFLIFWKSCTVKHSSLWFTFPLQNQLLK